ncbi:MAG: OprD family outer membrane porin [Sulfuricurvum sp.]
MAAVRLTLGTVLIFGGASAMGAETLSDAISQGHFSGKVRALYASSDFSDNAAFDDRYALGMGVRLSYETAPWYSLQGKLSLYGASGLGANSDNPNKVDSVYFLNTQSGGMTTGSVYGTSAQGYAVLGEAYVKGAFGKTMLQAGRMEIDAPFASSHDIYLVPNTFEAAQIVNVAVPDTTFVLAHTRKMSGPDMVQSNSFAGSTPGIQASDFVSISRASGFQGLADGDGKLTTEKDTVGATVAGGIYTGIEGLSAQAWFVRVWDIMDMPHLQLDYRAKIGESEYFGGIQWAMQSAIGGTKKTLAHPEAGGALVALGIDNIDAYHYEGKAGTTYAGMTLTLAYADTRAVEGNAARGGFVSPVGGNPSWVRARYQSPHFGYTDTSCYTGGTRSYMIKSEYDFTGIGVTGLTGEIAYLSFNRDNKYSANPGLLYYKANAYEDTQAYEASLDYRSLFGIRSLNGGVTLLRVDNDDAPGKASTDHTDIRVAADYSF